MKRDLRYFVFFKWRLLEAPHSVPFNLTRVWRDRHGFMPPYGFGAISGMHFVVDGGRAVRLERPDRLSVPEQLRAALFAVIKAKHEIELVRLAESGETPRLTRRHDRLPCTDDYEAVEEWPPPGASVVQEPVVAELALSPGAYLAREAIKQNCDRLDGAIVFADAAEAERHLDTLVPRPWATLRYLAAARAEEDQRDEAQVQGRAL